MVRYKNRYFVAAVDVKDSPSHAPFSLSINKLKLNILNKIQEIHGDFGVASVTSGLRVKYCNPYTKIILIRTRHGPHRFIGTVLPLMKTIDDVKVQLNVLYLGSTMMKCFKFIRNYQLEKLEYYWNKMKTEDDKIKLKEAILDIHSIKDLNS